MTKARDPFRAFFLATSRELSLFLLRVLFRENRVPVFLVGRGDRFLAFAPAPASPPSALDTSSPEVLLFFAATSFFEAGSALVFLLSRAIVFPNAERIHPFT
jgi:hypothetical protein